MQFDETGHGSRTNERTNKWMHESMNDWMVTLACRHSDGHTAALLAAFEVQQRAVSHANDRQGRLQAGIRPGEDWWRPADGEWWSAGRGLLFSSISGLILGLQSKYFDILEGFWGWRGGGGGDERRKRKRGRQWGRRRGREIRAIKVAMWLARF